MAAGQGVDLDRLKIPDAPAGRRGGWITALLCALCLAAGFFGRQLYERSRPVRAAKVKVVVIGPLGGAKAQTFRAGGWIEVATPAYPIFISSRISERIEAVAVKEGDQVKPGQTLVRLDDTRRKTALAVGQKQFATAQRELEKLKAGYRREDVQAAEARVRQAAEQLRYAKASYERMKDIQRDAVTVEDLDRALAAFRAADARHAEAAAERNKLLAGYQLEDIAIVQARADEAAAAVKLAELELSYCALAAPETGLVLRVLRVHRKVGEFINSDKPTAILELYDPKDMQVRVDVTQANVRFVKVGDKARVVTEAVPGREYPGTVLRIDPLAELAKNTLTVRVKLDAPDDMLFPEMVAHVAFGAAAPAEPAPSLLLPQEAVRQDAGGAYVLLSSGGSAVRRAVTVVGSQRSSARIGSGLESGQRVILSASEPLTEGQRIEEE